MREANYTYPPSNRATLNITSLLYDRRALDTSSPLAILNNLTSLTYLTQTSPRIREILTLDGGLERLLDILRESCFPRDYPLIPDMWGLNGPTTARVINFDRQMQLRHSLAFQCVVNIGVRGSEAIRTRVVQAGALDLVAQILETWLRQKGIAIFAGSIGSQAGVDAREANLPVPGTEEAIAAQIEAEMAMDDRGGTAGLQAISHFMGQLTGLRATMRSNPVGLERQEQHEEDTDVDMADVEGGDEATDGGSFAGADDSMDVEDLENAQAGPSTTPRARQALLPMPMNIPIRTIYSERREPISSASSAGTSLSVDDAAPIPRATSDINLAGAATAGPSHNQHRPPPLNLAATRIPALAQDPVSNQSSPMGTPTRHENVDGARSRGRRGTIIGRPVNVNLAVRNERRRDIEGGSGTSDGGEDVDLPAAIVAAGIAAANAQAMEGGGTVIPDEPGPPPNVEIVEGGGDDLMTEDPDAEAIAAEQARLDLEAGAPPGQPGAAQTPRAPPADGAAPLDPAVAAAREQQQIIIANGAPRGFHDLGSYVGISTLLNPENDQYSDDSILLALQLLAYLSKYPHVRSAFHHPRRPMHPTFDLSADARISALPERPAVSETPNIFSLVERFTFKPSPADPLLTPLPDEIQYWAGVIMRNACRKDEVRGGIRQCANMMCGKWESFPREFAKCRKCRKAKYCSKECQSRAWQEGHRFWCGQKTDDPPGEGGQAAARATEDGDDEIGDADIPADIRARAQALLGGQRVQPGSPTDVQAQWAAARAAHGGRLPGAQNPLAGFGRDPRFADPSTGPAGVTRGRTARPTAAPAPSPTNIFGFRAELEQMGLLEESLLGTRARPPHPDRVDRAGSRTAEIPAGAPLLSPGLIYEASDGRVRASLDPRDNNGRSPHNPSDMETPSAPRLSHRVARLPSHPDPTGHLSPLESSPNRPAPSRFAADIASPTPRATPAGTSHLMPEWSRQPWFTDRTGGGPETAQTSPRTRPQT